MIMKENLKSQKGEQKKTTDTLRKIRFLSRKEESKKRLRKTTLV